MDILGAPHIAPAHFRCILACFLFLDHLNDLLIGESRLYLPVLLLAGLYTNLEEIQGLRSEAIGSFASILGPRQRVIAFNPVVPPFLVDMRDTVDMRVIAPVLILDHALIGWALVLTSDNKWSSLIEAKHNLKENNFRNSRSRSSTVKHDHVYSNHRATKLIN